MNLRSAMLTGLREIRSELGHLDCAVNVAISAGVQHWKAEPELSVFRDPGALRL
jgi:hypothetical protein